jgi:hypothetical protein
VRSTQHKALFLTLRIITVASLLTSSHIIKDRESSVGTAARLQDGRMSDRGLIPSKDSGFMSSPNR